MREMRDESRLGVGDDEKIQLAFAVCWVFCCHPSKKARFKAAASHSAKKGDSKIGGK